MDLGTAGFSMTHSRYQVVDLSRTIFPDVAVRNRNVFPRGEEWQGLGHRVGVSGLCMITQTKYCFTNMRRNRTNMTLVTCRRPKYDPGL